MYDSINKRALLSERLVTLVVLQKYLLACLLVFRSLYNSYSKYLKMTRINVTNKFIDIK